MVARFRETIPTVKSVSSSEIYKIFWIFTEITIFPFFRKLEFFWVLQLRDEFESTRSHSIHQDPLPTVSQAIHKLVDNETCLQTEPISI